jgi:ribosomal protein S18 acetylase RimI-like enzyme
MEGLDFLDEEGADDDGEGGIRYISLPDWDSADGFRLMERFVSGFRNPMVREDLSSALNRGKGVFRAFKNALSRYPEAEKLWFAFKENEMKKEIVMWYNGLREEWGLERIGMEPEETADLVLEDFRFRPFREEDIVQAEELHSRCLDEYKSSIAEAGSGSCADILIKEAEAFRRNFSGAFGTGITAESGGGEFAGYISGVVKDAVLYIKNLEVKPEYRGLGIGEALLIPFLESLDKKEAGEALLDLPFWAEGFSRVLHREFFKPYTVRYWLSLKDRAD